MAISSILERTNDTTKTEKSQAVSENYLTEDELHNSMISENYAKLIDPDCSAKDILRRKEVEQTAKVDIFDTIEVVETQSRVEEPVQQQAVVEEKRVQADEPYFVRNARADSYIFRANSAVNSLSAEAQFKRSVTAPTAPAVNRVSDEENEDLLPTRTTIQYKTVAEVNRAKDGKVQNKQRQERRLVISKKEKITIAAVITMIVALFVLIIVNSAIISNLNKDLASLENSYEVVQENYDTVTNERGEYFAEDNLYQVVSDFAERNGMVKK